MGRLKVLPAQLANMIAAGEVVQRPASVVKELMENAVDAGASKITVVLTDSGRTMIQVIDNGCGMSSADAVMCFERHATSKIASPEDLSAILSYGFRGEALASIAAVSEVTLKTRRASDETAVKVVTGDSGKMKTSECSAPVGSNFSVRNLFYNTPARRKFLKSDNVELKHSIEEFCRIAICHPEIEFSLSDNGRDIYVLKAAKSLKFRILDVMGPSVAGDIVDVSGDSSIVKISGFVGRPESARKALGNQYFFVLGRYFRSPYLHKAVMKAYENLIPSEVTPSYFIFLDVDPSSIDVNIHPTKTEIKFEDDAVIFQILYACIKETLGRNSFGGSIDFESGEAPQMPNLSRSFQEYRNSGGSDVVDSTFDPFRPNLTFDIPDPDGAPVRKDENYGALFEEKKLPLVRTIIVKGKYIVRPSETGMMIVHIRRARERVLYEKYLAALSGSGHVSQMSMFPVSVQVGAAQKTVFDDNADILSSLGFDISPFGPDTIVVNAVPEGFSCEPGKVERMVNDLAIVLSEDSGSTLSEVLCSKLASKFAILGALNYEIVNSPEEAQALLDSLFLCETPEFTSSGQKIVELVGVDQIDKKF